VNDVGQMMRLRLGVDLGLGRRDGMKGVSWAGLVEFFDADDLSRGGRRCKGRGQGSPGHEDRGSGVLQHELQTFVGIRRVQRHVSPAGLQDRQHADNHFGRAVETETHGHIGSHLHGLQKPSEDVGPLV
jgi:hypothetical protein